MIDIDLSADFSTTITIAGGCASTGDKTFISFDSMGRPLLGDLNHYTQACMSDADNKPLQTNCLITLSSAGETDIVLTIRPETGYVSGI